MDETQETDGQSAELRLNLLIKEYESRISKLELKVQDLLERCRRDASSRSELGEPDERTRRSHQECPSGEHDNSKQYPGGIREIERTISEKGEVIDEIDKVLSEEELSKDPKDSFWLKIIHSKSQQQVLLPEKREVIVCDTSLLNLITSAIGPFIDHTGKAPWQQKELVLKTSSYGIIFNYPLLQQATKEASVGGDDQTASRGRLAKLLEILRSLQGNDLFQTLDLFHTIEESGSSRRDFRISWSNIWLMFPPGALIVSAWNQTEDLQIFKVHSFRIREPDYISILAWIWDWDGQSLVRTLYEFRIEKYDTPKAPTELTCFPLKFQPSAVEFARDRRALFRRFTIVQNQSPQLLHYQGDLISGYSDLNGDAALYRSALGIDPFSGLSRHYSKSLKVHKVDEDIVVDSQNYIRRSGGMRALGLVGPSSAKLCFCSLCISQETHQWQQALIKGTEHAKSDNDLLLAPRLTGFALGRKEWCQFSLDKISVVQSSSGSDSQTRLLNDPSKHHEMTGLILPEALDEEQQRDIFNMVTTHAKVMERSENRRVGDVIGGKGESLILLFHGTSGTGKTLYAECLAKASSRPLFKVGTSEIGLEAAMAERNLKDIFELAESWQAVLLIDEADVLLDARGNANEGHISKNALVSVLLREVEYFKGILILTTNRVMAFDAAVLTRIHHAVRFENPTLKQESDILRYWVEKVGRAGLTSPSVDKWLRGILKKKRDTLTGREIRNVFIQAQAMAARHSDGKISITEEHLDRAYEYRQAFRRDTRDLHIEARVAQK